MFRYAYSALFFAVLAFATPAAAQPPAPGPPAVTEARHPAPNNYSIQPLDRILPAIRSGRPGRFFDAEGPFPDGAGGWRYRIKWLTPEGRIVWLDADARTGRVLGPYRGYAGMALPPAGLRYYPFSPGPRGFRGRFGVWRPGGWRGGWGPGGRRR
ncbi:MAG TPA: hypothetical protein VIY09_06565 [Rhizomicrobium sp.]